ncbi:MAG: CotH kinase family protein [Fibrobacter sp.]|nr:CotH kinase family protein [Fibrobacter sp.]
MKKFGISALFIGVVLSACSGATDPSDDNGKNPGDEQGPSSSAMEEILVTDWEAEAAKEDGPTKKVLPKVSLPAAGFYKSVDIDVPTPTVEGGVVRCTFGGEEPTMETAQMTAPVKVDSSTVVRCYEFLQDSVVAQSTETYLIGESVSMPVVAVTVPPWYYKDILKADPCKPDPCKDAAFWLDTAVVAHVEYFPNGSSSVSKAFEIDAEASIMGGYSRNQKKKSVSINMKKKIQKGHFRYPLFETRPYQKKFKGFILRNNGNRFVSDYLEDAMGTSLLEGTQVDYQRSRQVVVFYNGHYYGIHDMREKLNEHFVETNYGIDAEAVDFVKHTNRTIDASGGTSDDYIDLLNFISSNDFSEENSEAYKTVKSRVNMQSLMEYLAAEIYYHNGDWPDNNLRAWRSGTQKWKFVAFDLDHGFDWEWSVDGFRQSTKMFDWLKTGGITTGSCYKSDDPLCFHNVFVKLNANPEFRRAFLNRASILYTTYVNFAKVTEATDRIAASIPKAESERDMKKFNREDLYYKNSCGKGFSVSGSCLKEWAEDRDGGVRKEFRNEYGVTEDIPVAFNVVGDGQILLDEMPLPSKDYMGGFFGGNIMMLTAKGNAKFVSWEDGSTDNPRFVLPVAGSIYTATFEQPVPEL